MGALTRLERALLRNIHAGRARRTGGGAPTKRDHDVGRIGRVDFSQRQREGAGQPISGEKHPGVVLGLQEFYRTLDDGGIVTDNVEIG